MDQKDVKLVFEQVEDRFPVDPGALRGHMGCLAGRKPVTEYEQVERHGAEGFDLFVGASARALGSDTAKNRTLVDIQSAAPLMNEFHLLLPPGGTSQGCPWLTLGQGVPENWPATIVR
jgi:hypothetical protein